MDKWMIFVVLGALVLMYVFMIVRQKRQAKKNEEAINSFRVGDKVITHIGIYGKIKRIYNTTYGKVCVLEIGTLNKIDVEMDMRYIAGLDEKTAVADEVKEEPKEQTKKEDNKEQSIAEIKEEVAVETKVESVEEKPQEIKKEKNNKKTKKRN